MRSGVTGVSLTSIGRWPLNFGPVLVCWGEVHVAYDIRRSAVVVARIPGPLVSVAKPKCFVAPREDLQKNPHKLYFAVPLPTTKARGREPPPPPMVCPKTKKVFEGRCRPKTGGRLRAAACTPPTDGLQKFYCMSRRTLQASQKGSSQKNCMASPRNRLQPK